MTMKILTKRTIKASLQGTLVVNWGSSEAIDMQGNGIILNKPECISKASNKLRAFQMLQGKVPVPEWTTDRSEALSWLPETIVCRTKLQAHSGVGIVLASAEDDVVNAPLYTKYFKKRSEYRVHVFRNEVIFVQRKARRLDTPDADVNWQIRNHSNGFIYANQNIVVSEAIQSACVETCSVLGLDFGAVDVIEKHNGSFVILEVNTAPGLTETTAGKYAEAILRCLPVN